jgi:hypothetical protein
MVRFSGSCSPTESSVSSTAFLVYLAILLTPVPRPFSIFFLQNGTFDLFCVPLGVGIRIPDRMNYV